MRADAEAPGQVHADNPDQKEHTMTAPEKTVRWGILGAGRIAHRFAASLAHVADARLVALSCRSAAKAAAFGAAFDVDAAGALSDEALGGEPGAAHEALRARDDIDAIYLALPHGLHRTWAIRALRAGKAVLCEKPAALSANEMRDIAAASRETGTLFMEAMKTRFTPCYARVRELVAAGAIGRITRVETALENDMGERLSSRTAYMSDPKQGGVLLDTGIYCACWLEDYLAGQFEVTRSRARFDTDVDSFVDTELSFAGQGDTDSHVTRAAAPNEQATARLITACDSDELPRQARLIGTKGTIIVDDLHRPVHAEVRIEGEDPYTIDLPYEVDDFYGQIHHFCELMRTGAPESPIMPLAASIRCAEMLDAIRASLIS